MSLWTTAGGVVFLGVQLIFAQPLSFVDGGDFVVGLIECLIL